MFCHMLFSPLKIHHSNHYLLHHEETSIGVSAIKATF